LAAAAIALLCAVQAQAQCGRGGPQQNRSPRPSFMRGGMPQPNFMRGGMPQQNLMRGGMPQPNMLQAGMPQQNPLLIALEQQNALLTALQQQNALRAAQQQNPMRVAVRRQPQPQPRPQPAMVARGGQDQPEAKPADLEEMEQTATRRLNLARRLIVEGKAERAAERLREIIRMFPTTTAADHAQLLLKELDE
jgi:TolA-binding protein